MNTLIYIKILPGDVKSTQESERQFHYTYMPFYCPLLNRLSTEATGFDARFDADSASGTEVLFYAGKLLEESTHCTVVINNRTDGDGKQLFTFFNKLLRHKHKVRVLMLGAEGTLWQLLRKVGGERAALLTDEDELVKRVS